MCRRLHPFRRLIGFIRGVDEGIAGDDLRLGAHGESPRPGGRESTGRRRPVARRAFSKMAPPRRKRVSVLPLRWNSQGTVRTQPNLQKKLDNIPQGRAVARVKLPPAGQGSTSPAQHSGSQPQQPLAFS